MAAGTRGVAGIQVLRRGKGPPAPFARDAGIRFTFVMAGTLRLEAEGQAPRALAPGDAFVLPPGLRTRYADPSDDAELLEVALRGDCAVTLKSCVPYGGSAPAPAGPPRGISGKVRPQTRASWPHLAENTPGGRATRAGGRAPLDRGSRGPPYLSPAQNLWMRVQASSSVASAVA